MSVYSFTAANKSIYHATGAEIVFQFQKQKLDYSTPLSHLSWTSSVVNADRCPISAPIIERGASTDPGEIMGTFSNLEAKNIEFISGMRMSDVLDFDPYSEILHIRIGYRVKNTFSFSWFSGVVDYQSVNYSIDSLTNKDRWFIKFDAKDTLSILAESTMSGFQKTVLSHVDYDVSSSNVYLSYLDSSLLSHIGQGKVRYGGYYDYDRDNRATNVWNDNLVMRFISITSIFNAASVYLGLEGRINNGADWSQMVTSTFWYNNSNYSGVDDLELLGGGIEHLYVPFGYYNGSYHNQWTMWDENNCHEISLHKLNSALEALKFWCVSLNLEMSIKMSSTDQRYLEVKEIGKSFGAWVNLIDSNRIEKGVKYNAYPDKVDGIKVNSAYGNSYTVGQLTNSYTQLDCLFSSGQNVARKHLTKKDILNLNSDDIAKNGHGAISTSTSPWTVYVDRGSHEMQSALFICLTSASGDAPCRGVPHLHTVAAIVPRRNSVSIPSTAIPPEIEHFHGGQYQTTLPTLATINGVMFPTRLSYNNSGRDWELVPAMVVAHYNYSLTSYDSDPVGINRKFQREMVIRYPETPGFFDRGQEFELVIGGETKTYRLNSIKYDLSDFSATMTLQTLE
jgi:hypothetical protein